MLVHRSKHFIFSFPQRLKRLLLHICFSDLGVKQSFGMKIAKWVPGVIVLFIDLIALPEIYDCGTNACKSGVRELNDEEFATAQCIFADALPLPDIRIDQHARFGPKQWRFAYVSFFTVNVYGKLPIHLLIHELVHVWQYMSYGSLYIVHALFAQHSTDGYNYGGVEKLKEVKARGGHLSDFNFEQQADIVSDYYLIVKGYRPQWAGKREVDIEDYEYFVKQIS